MLVLYEVMFSQKDEENKSIFNVLSDSRKNAIDCLKSDFPDLKAEAVRELGTVDLFDIRVFSL